MILRVRADRLISRPHRQAHLVFVEKRNSHSTHFEIGIRVVLRPVSGFKAHDIAIEPKAIPEIRNQQTGECVLHLLIVFRLQPVCADQATDPDEEETDSGYKINDTRDRVAKDAIEQLAGAADDPPVQRRPHHDQNTDRDEDHTCNSSILKHNL